MEYNHVPVMLEEVLEILRPTRGGYFIDCTLGGGGYTYAISQRVGSSGRVLAIDLDKGALDNLRTKNLKNVISANDNFKNLTKIIENNFGKGICFDGIVLDLGLSSYQLEDKERGFSFNSEGPLNMAFGESAVLTEKIINKYREEELAKIIQEYGEEGRANQIAKEIVKRRREKTIETPKQLSAIIEEAVSNRRQGRIHPATKTFQALRIATNDELENLKQVLPQAVRSLKVGGRLAVVSFHSLEDRIVKNFFRDESHDCLCPPKLPVCVCGHKKTLKIIAKKALSPTDKEIKNNPRSRSARLRVAEKIS